MRLTDEPKTLRDMKPDIIWPPAIEGVMKQALQRKSGERYQKAEEFGNALMSAVESMPKQQQADMTMVMGAAAATAMIQAPPATRVDPNAGAAARRSAAAPVAPAPAAVTAPAKSKVPLIAGGGVAAAAAAVAVFFAMSKGGTVPVKPDSSAPAPAPVVSAPVNQVANPGTNTTPLQAPVLQGTAPPRRQQTPAETKSVASPSGTTSSPNVAVSYANDLDALANSVNDESSAKGALTKVADYESKVSLPADKAALSFVEAKATMIAVGAEKGCRMMRIVRRNELNKSMKSDLDEALKECGSP